MRRSGEAGRASWFHLFEFLDGGWLIRGRRPASRSPLRRPAIGWTIPPTATRLARLQRVHFGIRRGGLRRLWRIHNNGRDVNLALLVQRAPLGVDQTSSQL